jgi:hypothetical protein
MEDETSRLVEKVQELGDIELAALLCLTAQEHCIIETDEEELENVEQELKLVSRKSESLRLILMYLRLPTTLLDSLMPLLTALKTPPRTNFAAAF